jgi:hypothetical protein
LRRPPRSWPLLVGGCALAFQAPAGSAGEPALATRLAEREIVVLEVRPLNATLQSDDPELRLELVIDPLRGGELKLPLGWPDPADRCELVLRAESRPAPAGGEGHRVTLEAGLVLPAGERVQRERLFDVVEGTSTLFEVYRRGDRALTLAIQARIESQTVLPGPPRIGARVTFDLEIERVLAGRVVPLETNRLSTFLGEPVSYSFHLGPAGVADTARLTLRPLTLAGEVVEIEVTINGSLTAASGPEFVARTEQWFASRNATTTAAFESGDPPTGYRFLVTPRF